MRQSLSLLVALATLTTAQTASSLTFWLPGPANNPSSASRYDMGTTTFPPVATILSSAPSTTIFGLGCASDAPATLFNGAYNETCPWSTDSGTYSIISSTVHVLHRTQDDPSASMWWSCTNDVVATRVTCDLEVSGNVNDNTNGTVSGLVWGKEPDRLGNVIAFATAEVASEGNFGVTALSTGSEGTASATGSKPSTTAASSASAGVAGVFGVDAARLAALVGGAAVVAW